MDQVYYNKIRELKVQGKYQECINIYMQHINEEDADATFFDGLAKIYMLTGEFDKARLSLLEVFRKIFVFRMHFLDRLVNNKLESVNEILFSKTFEDEMMQAMKVYELFSNLQGEDHAKSVYVDLRLSKIELTLCYCNCFDDTYFRYYFCLACQCGFVENAAKLCRALVDAKSAILNVFKGVASQEERIQYERVYQMFIKGVDSNKYAYIFNILRDFANYLKIK